MSLNYPIRINKYLAYTGVASRREADALIADGKVQINGKKAEMGQQVAEDDEVTVLGKTKEKKYFAYYKGAGIISHSPTADEVDIATKIKVDYGLTDVFPIGRLDKSSEGLILLTNDGRLTGPLLDPERSNEKEYEVTVDKPVTGMFLKQMQRGVSIEGYVTKPAVTTKHPKNNKKFTIVLTEGQETSDPQNVRSTRLSSTGT